jgi:hypothetical protein
MSSFKHLLIGMLCCSYLQCAHAADSSAFDSSSASELTPKELKILAKGEISTERYLGAGILGSLVGFGSGQAVEGRYLTPGMIFSIGEGTGVALMLISPIFSEQSAHDRQEYGDDEPRAIAVLGLTVFSLFRIADIVDVWLAPPILNARYRRVKAKQENAEISNIRFIPVLLNERKPGLGVVLTF